MDAKTKLETRYKIILIVDDGSYPVGMWKNGTILRLIEVKDCLSEEDAMKYIEDQNDFSQYQIMPYIIRVIDFED